MKRKKFLDDDANAKNEEKNQFPLKNIFQKLSRIVHCSTFRRWKNKKRRNENLQKDEMITYAEMSLALETFLSMEKIDIPSTMTKGKHLKGEIHLMQIYSLLLLLFLSRRQRRRREGQGRNLKWFLTVWGKVDQGSKLSDF